MVFHAFCQGVNALPAGHMSFPALLENSRRARNHSYFSLVLDPLVSNQANHVDRLELTPNGD
ncbi:hypothetical protein HMPREF0970_00938 [Schaalia odontolytica F0309]|uniref:Uncharacterized protein n=1 Tax=Schaalia odontolytica F0309 TaxID=649742 RepID=D4TYB3_9ACTO|nr:hypothetical protein HMPREF0970_00938 [Schaalia odontolytica F0309]